MKWVIPIKKDRSLYSKILFRFYNQFVPILFTLLGSSFFGVNVFVGYFFFILAFVPVFFTLEFDYNKQRLIFKNL